MGGSVGLALQAAGYRGQLVALARDPSDAEAAVGAGAVHEGFTRVEDLPAGIQLFCLAVPLSAMPQVLRQLAPRLTDAEVIVTDVGSVKVPVVTAAAGIMPHPGNYVGAHPMAGFRQRGVTFARADLFHGVHVILTPVSATHKRALEVIRSMWSIVHGHVTTMSPVQHDELIARVSHLPHVSAALLLLEAAREEGLSVAGTGLLDVTRVASRDAWLWQDILVSNREQVREAIGRLIEDLRRVDTWLERHEDGNIGRLLQRAAQIRDEWVASKFEHPDWID
ncbi:MAG: prephenate dehydrogenase/arogenate dehydrogenase family protein [Phycisphaerae bacterium]|jgi:prephenate dehydrogenase